MSILERFREGKHSDFKKMFAGLDDALKLWSLADKTKPLLVKDDLECGFKG